MSGLKFDAWAHHPYPTSPNLPPLQKVRYPNVTLSTLPLFEKQLKTSFHRTVPIWITEYGHETKPGEPKGVTTAKQSAYAKQALTIAKNDPNVQMFVWFVFRDSTGNPWQSGLEVASGAHKPAFDAFSALAHLTDGQTLTVAAGKAPRITVYVPYLGYYVASGTQIGVYYTVQDGSKVVDAGDPDGTTRHRPVRVVHTGVHAREEPHVHRDDGRERAQRPFADPHHARQGRLAIE